MDNYNDIINLQHHISLKRRRMSNHDRAAQFAPFAALTGYEDAVAETGRLTDRKTELSEEEITDINRKLNFLKEHLKEELEITVEYFVADLKKSGGKYDTVTDILKKIDENEKKIILSSDKEIFMQDIMHIYFVHREFKERNIDF